MLPFVKERENMLPEVNVDNIETSVNRLKNTFTQLTQDLKIGEYFKKIVDWANGMLGNIQTSFMRVVAVIAAALVGGKLYKAISNLTQHVKNENAKILENKIQTEQQSEIATKKRIAAEKYHNKLNAIHSKASDDEKLNSYIKLNAAKRNLDKWREREKAGLLAKEVAAEKAAAAETQTVWAASWTKIGVFLKNTLSTIGSMFASLIPMAVIGLLTNFIMKIVEARKEAKEISNIFS